MKGLTRLCYSMPIGRNRCKRSLETRQPTFIKAFFFYCFYLFTRCLTTGKLMKIMKDCFVVKCFCYGEI